MEELGEEIDAKEGFKRKLAGRWIKWAGHVEGMENERLMKRTDALRGEGKITRERRGLIWDDGVKRSKVGVGGEWRTRARDKGVEKGSG